MAAYQVLLLNTAVPQIQAAQSGDTYVVPRDIAFSTVASLAAGTEALPSLVATGDVNTGFWFPAADTIAASTGGTRRLTIDASGNLGLGVAPGDWNANNKVFQLTNNASLFSRSGLTGVAQNFRYNASDTGIFMSAGYATLYYQNAGAHIWTVSTTSWNGTGSDTASMSQAMTLDASGNLLVGTTTSSNRTITVGAASASIALADANGGIYFGATGTPVGSGGFGVNAAIARAGGTNFHISGSVAGDLCIAPEGTKAILFGTSASASSVSERARITSGGEVLFGLNAQTNTPANGFVFQNLGTTSSQVLIGHSNGSGSGTYYEAYFYDSTVIGSVTQNGTTGVLYNITSDYRLKTVTGPVTDAGSRIDALEPVEYTWKANGASARGFLAHKFQEVYPNSVTGQKDAVDAEGNPVYQNMQASTSEVIADLVAELQSLRARVAQLEAK